MLLFNRGPASDTYLISVQGIPLEWLASPPQPVRVPANSQSLARLVIRPPRSPLVRAGRYRHFYPHFQPGFARPGGRAAPGPDRYRLLAVHQRIAPASDPSPAILGR